jgi:hypothetical protein
MIASLISVVAQFEFLMAASCIADGVILSAAAVQAERRISTSTGVAALGDPSARW